MRKNQCPIHYSCSIIVQVVKIILTAVVWCILNLNVRYSDPYCIQNSIVFHHSSIFPPKLFWILSITTPPCVVLKTSTLGIWICKRGWMPNCPVFECRLNTGQPDHLNTKQMDVTLFSYVLVQYFYWPFEYPSIWNMNF